VRYRAALIVLSCLLSGCSSLFETSVADIAGVGGAAISGAATSNPAVAAGIALLVQAGARAGVQYVQRQVHGASQDEIASAGGDLAIGEIGTWRTHHRVAIEFAQHGRVTVSRVISEGAIPCKELVFSVDSPREDLSSSRFYVVSVCRDGARWKWATAEPATARWGALQ
jgi:hypothetical protein